MLKLAPGLHQQSKAWTHFPIHLNDFGWYCTYKCEITDSTLMLALVVNMNIIALGAQIVRVLQI